jgi:hypothetical protein
MGEAAEPFHLTAEDRKVLQQTDDEYTLLTWDFVKSVIGIETT